MRDLLGNILFHFGYGGNHLLNLVSSHSPIVNHSASNHKNNDCPCNIHGIRRDGYEPCESLWWQRIKMLGGPFPRYLDHCNSDEGNDKPLRYCLAQTRNFHEVLIPTYPTTQVIEKIAIPLQSQSSLSALTCLAFQ